MKLAMSKTRGEFPLSQRKPLKKTIAGVLSLIALVLIILFSATMFTCGLQIKLHLASIWFWTLLSLILITALYYLYQVWYFQVYFYDLTDDFIIIRKRVFTPREITIPYERVQDVYVDQDLLDRVMGLYDVHLSSATVSSGLEAHIDGVEKDASDGLRKVMLEKVTEKIKRAKS